MRQAQQVIQIEPEAKVARDQAQLVAEGRVRLLLRTPDGQEIAVDPVFDSVVHAVVGPLADGRTVLVAGNDATVATTEAARMLGVSRPMVTRWIAEGLLVDVPVGSHHRIPVESVMELREARNRAGRRAMVLLQEAEKDPEVAARVEAAQERARKRIAARPAR
jgi:excisionase family DNA binding protein